MKRLLLVLLLLSSPALAYTKPAGVPTYYVEDYGVTIGVWAEMLAIGQGVAVFELQPNGTWTTCHNCAATANPSSIDADVATAGGVDPYVVATVPKVNAVLARRYPPIGGNPSPNVSTIYQINQLLGTYRIEGASGQPVLVAK